MHEDLLIKRFAEISAVPRASGCTGPVADYLVSFAKMAGLDYIRDGKDNVVIFKDPSPGYESSPTVMLQAHTDMVQVYTPGTKQAEAASVPEIRVSKDGDLLYAVNSSLGADDGIGCAMMLEILSDNTLYHPRLECVFTSDEEIGLLGAAALDCSVLKAKYMINLDSEDEGIFCVGCCGGTRVDFSIPIEYNDENAKGVRLSISGLKGGHSGTEIGKSGNALKLLGRLISMIPDAALADISGGERDNAIPSHASAAVTNTTAEAVIKAWKKISYDVTRQDPDASLEITEIGTVRPFSDSSSEKILSWLDSVPCGITEMSRDIPGLPQTSCNLAVIHCEDSKVCGCESLRSASSTALKDLADTICKSVSALGGNTSRRGDYPGWEYRPDSQIRKVMLNSYRELFHREAKVEIIHAGLECGLITSAIPGLDAISLGPQMQGVHTVGESLSISSAQRTFSLLKKALENLR